MRYKFAIPAISFGVKYYFYDISNFQIQYFLFMSIRASFLCCFKRVLLSIGFLILLQNMYAQNVGIGTGSPEALLHLGGNNVELLIDNGPILLRNSSSGEATQLSGIAPYTLVSNNYSNGTFVFRPGTIGKEFIMSGTGLVIGARAALGGQLPATPLDIRADGEVLRINGVNPYLSLMDGNVQRGYLQAWTDGIALASVNHDVGLWTNSVKRLAVKPNGALEVAGSTGSAGQVLTSNGSGLPPAWSSATTALYNSVRFVTPSQSSFVNTSDNVWRDVPGMTTSLSLSGNTYVDIAANMYYTALPCLGCDNPAVEFRLVVNTINFTEIKGRTGGAFERTNSLTTGFTLPAGSHTIKWQIRSTDGSDVVVFGGANFDVNYRTFMRLFTAAQ